MERNFKFTNLSGVILFYIVDFKYYPNISYHTGLVKSMCKITKF